MPCPPPAVPGRRRVPGLALLLLLAGAGGCDEKFEKFLKSASDRQQAREEKQAEVAALKARGLGPPDPVAPEIARAIQVVRTSDYDFVVRKGRAKPLPRGTRTAEDAVRRYNGFDFAASLESKSRWLGRGITDLPTWLDEIGSSTFFSNDTYLVRLPDGREFPFRKWLLDELAALPPEPPKEETP